MCLYEILGIKKNVNVTAKEIRSAYHKLALLHHPDKGGDPETFRKISSAYQILSDPHLRTEYDMSSKIPDIDLFSPIQVFSDYLSKYVDIISTSVDLFTSLTAKRKTVQKQLNIPIDQVYANKDYDYSFVITGSDLGLSNQYTINNPDISIKIPLSITQVEIETTLNVIGKPSYIQTVLIVIDINVIPTLSCYKIDEYDILYYVDVTQKVLKTASVISMRYFDKIVSFYNPHNHDLKQLYIMEGMGLPFYQSNEIGNLYILFNLILGEDPHPIPNIGKQTEIYTLKLVNLQHILRIV